MDSNSEVPRFLFRSEGFVGKVPFSPVFREQHCLFVHMLGSSCKSAGNGCRFLHDMGISQTDSVTRRTVMTVRSERPHTANRGPPYNSKDAQVVVALFSPLFPFPSPSGSPRDSWMGKGLLRGCQGLKRVGPPSYSGSGSSVGAEGSVIQGHGGPRKGTGGGRGGPGPTHPPAHPGYREQKDAFQDAQLGRHGEGRRWRVFVCLLARAFPTLPWDIDWSDAMVYVRYFCVSYWEELIFCDTLVSVIMVISADVSEMCFALFILFFARRSYAIPIMEIYV